MNELQIVGMCKNYSGKNVLSNINVSIKKPGVYLFAGPNGSGKTTLLEILIGIRTQTEGDCYLLSNKNNSHVMDKEKISFLTQQNTLRGNCFVYEEIQLVAELYNVPAFDYKDFLRKYGLEEYYKYKTRKLSGGTQRRLLVALTLLPQLDIVIMDEPVSGLDTFSRNEIWNMISEAAKEKIVIVSDHYLNQACQYSDYVYFLDKGIIVKEGTIEKMMQSVNANYVARCRKERTTEFSTLFEQYNIEYEKREAGTVDIFYLSVSDLSIIGGLSLGKLIMPITFEDIYFYITGQYSRAEEE